MKKIHIEFTDKQHCLLTRIAKADRRKLRDLIYLTISEGLGSVYCETSLGVEKTPDEYTQEDKKQIAKNKKLEKSKDWDSLNWEERQTKGHDHVSEYMHNHPHGKDFLVPLAKSIESNILEGVAT